MGRCQHLSMNAFVGILFRNPGTTQEIDDGILQMPASLLAYGTAKDVNKSGSPSAGARPCPAGCLEVS